MEFLLDSNRKMEVDIINIKLGMSSFSRKLILLFAIIFWQSSLGTNAALKDFSNVTTKSLGQNGYYKFPDGLIIQWGYQGMSGSGNITIYFPSAFYDTNYSIGTTFEVISSEPSLHVVMFYTRQRTYFSVRRRFGNSGEEGDTGRGFTWIAIGRWKQ